MGGGSSSTAGGEGKFDAIKSSTTQDDGVASISASDTTGERPDLNPQSDAVILGSDLTLKNFPVGITQLTGVHKSVIHK